MDDLFLDVRITSWLLVGWFNESHGVGALLSWAHLFPIGDWSFQCENQCSRMNVLYCGRIDPDMMGVVIRRRVVVELLV